MRSGNPDRAQNRRRSGGDSDQSRDNRLIVAAVVFAIGVLFGMIILGASVYADFESTLFDVFLNTVSSPGLIECPILMSSDEGGVVSAAVKNKTEIPVEQSVRVYISRGHLTLLREIEEHVELGPGEEIVLEWELTKKDSAYGHLIFAKVQLSEDDRDSPKRGSCGILVLDLPFGLKGRTVVAIMYAISFLGIIAAIALWRRIGRTYTGIRLEATRGIFVLGAMVLLGLVFALIGLWELAAGAFYIAILAIGVVVPHYVINVLRSVEPT